MAKIFLVGGCIRDKFLGLTSKDIDFTFVCEESSTVEQGWDEMKTWMTSRGFEIFLETQDCFTIRAKFPIGHQHEGLVADFVMARKEVGYYEGTRRPILELGDLTDDLMRRDFTVNALAEDLDGNIIDLFNGRGDLKAGLLRTPLDPHITFMDDPLRILRLCRFSVTKGFTPVPDIWEALEHHEIIEKLEKTVSGERIREEIGKMFEFDTVKSIFILQEVEKRIPGFTELVFGTGLWLKPTFKQRKSK